MISFFRFGGLFWEQSWGVFSMLLFTGYLAERA
jgi:hypothetical protein